MLVERAVAPVDEVAVLHRVVGHVQVVVAVAVGVERADGEPERGFERNETGLRRRIDELRDAVAVGVSVVAVVAIVGRLQIARPAEDFDPSPDARFGVRRLFAARRVAIEPELDVIGDVQVEVAVAVGVGPCGRRRPLVPIHTGKRRDVVERSIAVVPVQPVRAPIRDVDVGIPVVVVIRHRRPDAAAAIAETRCRRDVGETRHAGAADPIVPVQAVRGPLRLFPRGSLNEVKVGVPVVVVVQPGGPGAERIDDVVGVGVPGDLDDVQTRLGRYVREVRCGRFRSRGLGGISRA